MPTNWRAPSFPRLKPRTACGVTEYPAPRAGLRNTPHSVRGYGIPRIPCGVWSHRRELSTVTMIINDQILLKLLSSDFEHTRVVQKIGKAGVDLDVLTVDNLDVVMDILGFPDSTPDAAEPVFCRGYWIDYWIKFCETKTAADVPNALAWLKREAEAFTGPVSPGHEGSEAQRVKRDDFNLQDDQGRIIARGGD